MTVASYFEALSIESLFLVFGMIGLMAIITGLHFRNIRRMHGLRNSQAAAETRARIEKLITGVEKMMERPKPTAGRARPVNSGPKFVPAARATKPSTPYIRSR